MTIEQIEKMYAHVTRRLKDERPSTVTMRPSRGRPGRHGTLFVTAYLPKGFGALDNGKVTRHNCEIELGDAPLTMLEFPKVSGSEKLAAGLLKGRKAFSDMVIFAAPVRVADFAKNGTYPVSGKVTLDLVELATGKSAGTESFQAEGQVIVVGAVEVAGAVGTRERGSSNPLPSGVSARASAQASTRRRDSGPGRRAAGQETSDAPAETPRSPGAGVLREPSPQSPPPSDDTDPAPREVTVDRWTIAVVGSLLCGGLIWWFCRGRRGSV